MIYEILNKIEFGKWFGKNFGRLNGNQQDEYVYSFRIHAAKHQDLPHNKVCEIALLDILRKYNVTPIND